MLSSSSVQRRPVPNSLALGLQVLTHCWVPSISWCLHLPNQGLGVWNSHSTCLRSSRSARPLIFLDRVFEHQSWRGHCALRSAGSTGSLSEGPAGGLDRTRTLPRLCKEPGHSLDPLPPLFTGRRCGPGVRRGGYLRGTCLGLQRNCPENEGVW